MQFGRSSRRRTGRNPTQGSCIIHRGGIVAGDGLELLASADRGRVLCGAGQGEARDKRRRRTGVVAHGSSGKQTTDDTGRGGSRMQMARQFWAICGRRRRNRDEWRERVIRGDGDRGEGGPARRLMDCKSMAGPEAAEEVWACTLGRVDGQMRGRRQTAFVSGWNRPSLNRPRSAFRRCRDAARRSGRHISWI